MKDRPTKIFPNDIEETRQELESWRHSRTGRERIPQSLWTKAVELGRQHGLCRTARALRLDYSKLKRLAGGAEPGGELRTGPSFVELIGSPGSMSECVVEMENGQGARMRIQLKGGVADVVGLSRTFWSERV